MLTMREYEREQLGGNIYLPDTLGALIRDALDVAMSVDGSVFTPDYESVFEPQHGGAPLETNANWAGLVMAGRFGASPYGARLYEDYGRNAGRLLALTAASEDNIDEAMAFCDFDFEPEEAELRARVDEISAGWSDERKALVAKYKANPPAWGKYFGWKDFRAFRGEMLTMSADLVSVGW